MEIVSVESIPELKIIHPKVFKDQRGYFLEYYHKERYSVLGIKENFVQDNESKSTKGVLRGLHYQTGENAQAKIVRVTKGRVWDVAVDLREKSPTFKKWYGLELSEENHLQFYIPRGFAHGFLVLSDIAVFSYKCDNFYNKESEGGVIYDDKELNIGWPELDGEILVSEKDIKLPTLDNAILF